MGANEQLGIELKVIDTTAVNTMEKLLATVKSIQDALKGIGGDNLTKTIQGIGGAGQGISGTATAVDALSRNLHSLGKTSDTIKTLAGVLDNAKASVKAVATEAGKLSEVKINANMWNEFQKANKQLVGDQKLTTAELGKVYRDMSKNIESTLDGLIINMYNKMSRTRAIASNMNDNLSVSRSGYTPSPFNPINTDAHVATRNKFILDGEVALGTQQLTIIKNTAAAAKMAEIATAKERQAALLQIRAEELNDQIRMSAAARAAWANNSWGNGLSRNSQEAMGTAYLSSLSKQKLTIDPSASGVGFMSAISPTTISNVEKLRQAIVALNGASPKQVSDEIHKLGINLQNIKGSSEWSSLDTMLRKFGMTIKNTANEVQDLKKQTDAVKNGFFSFLPDTLGRMAARLAEFYSIRTVMFAVTGEFRNTITTLLDLNQAIHDTLAITGASPKNFKDMEQAAISMAKSTKFSAVEVATAMKTLAQAGVSGQDLIPVTNVATMLATGTGATIEQASKILTTGMNVWKIDAKDSIGIANVLTGALNASKLEIGELGTAFNYLANQSALTGRSLTETAALIATLRNQGVEASTIGTSMSQMQKTLEAPTPRFKKLLAAYQINPEDIRPTKNSMVEIIQVFEEAAKKMGNNSIAIGDIFSGLETRVGRGFATLVQAGSESLRQMEEQIKNTNAAAVAWAESMKGARSQINILKAELTDTISVLSKNFSSFVGAKDVLRDFIVGMRDTSSQAAMLTVVLGGLAVALRSIAMSHPATATLTAIGLGVAALAAKIGNSNRAIAADFDKLNNSVAGSARDFKNATDELSGLNRELALHKRNADGTVAVTDEYKSILNTILDKYPNLAANLKDERGLQAAITAELKLQNDQRRETARLEAGKYGETAGRANQQVKDFRKSYKETFNEELPKGASVSTMEELLNKKLGEQGFLQRINIHNKMNASNLTNQLSSIKESVPALNNTVTLIKGNVGYVPQVDSETGLTTSFKFNPSLENAVNKVATNNDTRLVDPSKNAHTTPKYKAVDFEEIDRDFVNNIAKVAADTKVKVLEDEIKQTVDNMKFASESNSAQEFKEEDTKLTKQLQELVVKKRKEVYDSEWAKLLGEARGKFTPDEGNGTFDGFATKQDEKNFVAYIDIAKERIQQIIEAQVPAFDSRSELNGSKRPLFAPTRIDAKLQKDTSMRDEKAEGLRLRDELAGLNLQKQRAASADEERLINIQIAEAQKQSAEKVKEIYEKQQDKIVQDIAIYKTAEEYESALDAAGDRVDELKFKIKEMGTELDRAKDNGFFSNLTDGARAAMVAFGDFKSNTQKLGSSVTNTGINGVTDSLVSATNAAFNPDKEKVNGIKGQINQLNIDKAQLIQDINTINANTSKSPEEIKNLHDKRIALAGINQQLDQQNKSLKSQTNAWQSFADGLRKTMVSILQELQRYITQLLVVAMVKKLAGLASSYFGGTENALTNTGGRDIGADIGSNNYSSQLKIDKFATGGMVPLNMGTRGKDSVLSWVEPGEIIIKRSSVEAIGPERLLYANEHGTMPKFANGGNLAGDKAGNIGTEGKQEFTLQIVNIAQNEPVPNVGENAQQIINVINSDIAKRGPTYRTIKGAMAG